MKKVIPFLIGGIFSLLGYSAIGVLFCPGAQFCPFYVVNFFQLGAIVLIVGALIGGVLGKRLILT